MHTHMHARTHTHACTHAHTHTHARTHARTHAHTHTYVGIGAKLGERVGSEVLQNCVCVRARARVYVCVYSQPLIQNQKGQECSVSAREKRIALCKSDQNQQCLR